MTETIVIRPEVSEDEGGIREVNVQAFRDHAYSHQTEHLIVEELRGTGALELSLVAVADHQVVGPIAFSPARLGEVRAGWFLVGPVAGMPSFQHRGIGSALVEAGVAALRARRALGCVLVGDPGFYGRFGFAAVPGVIYEGVPEEYVLCLPFGPEISAGTVGAHPAFLADAEAGADDAVSGAAWAELRGGICVACDEALDERVAALVLPWGATRKKMFGGTGYLLQGNMVAGVNGSRVVLRLSPEAGAEALADPRVRPFDMTPRPMAGWVTLDGADVEGDELEAWLVRARTFVETLPPK